MRKRGEWPSAERSDTRGCGSRIAPTGASEARSRYSGDAASRRGWRAKGAGASPCGTVARPRALFTRRTRPEVPCAVTVGAAAERTEAGGGELCRTRPRRRICIRRAGRRTRKSPALHREHGCPDRDRTWKGKPALHYSRYTDDRRSLRRRARIASQSSVCPAR